MKTLKKTLCLVLAVVMAVGVLVIPANAAEFTDADEITHDEAVAVLNGLGIVNGDENGNFKPDSSFTRADAAVLLANVVLKPENAKLLTASKVVFSDVPANHYANRYITWANEAGYIHGYPDGTFKPSNELTGLELAALMLEVLGEELDSANFQNFVALKTKDYDLAKGITGYISTNVISRDDAVQMMFNAMDYSADAKTIYHVTDVKTEEEDYGNYPTLNEALTVVALLGGTSVAKAVPVPNKTGSIFTKVYEASHTPNGTDDLKRPVNTWKDSDGNTLYSVTATPAAEYHTSVKFSKIYADLGLTKAAPVTTYMFGSEVADAQKTITYAGGSIASEQTKSFVGNGTKVEVYNDGDGSYTMIIIPETFVKAGTAKETTSSETGKKTITQPFTRVGRDRTPSWSQSFSSTKFNNFAKDSYVILNVAGASNTPVSATVPEIVTGVLGKVVTANGNTTYTIGGKDYTKAVECDSSMNLNNIGQEVSVYVDEFGYILGSVTAAAAVNKYIDVLAASATTTSGNWMLGTEVKTQKVYGILSTGEYNEYTVTLQKEQEAIKAGIYIYDYNTDGTLKLSAVDAASAGQNAEEIKNGSATTKLGSTTVALNSSTIYYFFSRSSATNAISSFTTKTGNTNAGVIAKNSAMLVVEKGVVKFVFVGDSFNAGVINADMAYIKSNDSGSVDYGTVEYNDGTTSGKYYTYTAYTPEGKVTLTSSVNTLTAGVYNYNTDMSVGSKVETNVVDGKLTVEGTALGITKSGTTTYYNYDSDNVAYTGDDVDLADGQEVVAVVDSYGTTIVHLWVIKDAPIAG